MLQNSKTFKIRKTAKSKFNIQSPDAEEVANLQDLRLAEDFDSQIADKSQNKQKKITPKHYANDQQELNCYRFPHSSFCGCTSNCLLQSFDIKQVIPGLYLGDFVTGLKSAHLLDIGITHVLNVTSKQYTKRKQYFTYLNIDLHNNTEQDAKKFFRISNRFIKNTINEGGKVLIHSSVSQIGAVMAIGFLIGIKKVPLKQSLQMATKGEIQISPHFMKQVELYDLEKMAFVSIQRQ